jgi:SNF2 family DNA or RNA helicase
MVTLWPNQRSGVEWLSGRQYGMLAHEMGCGKTGTALEAVRDLRLVLVICPIAVGPAWMKQASTFDPDREVCVVVEGSSAKRAAAVRSALDSGKRVIVVVNYDAVWRGEVAKAIESARWDAIICDESHRIKSPSGKASRWLAKLAQRQPNAKRICLTGTPCPNNPLDWFGQARFLDPGLLGKSITALRDRIAVIHPRHRHWIVDWKPEALEAMTQRLDPHIHRVTAAEVLTLPDAIHTVVEVRLSPETSRFYRDLESQMIARLANGEVITAANKLVVVGRLQLAAGGYTRPDDTEEFVRIADVPDKRKCLADFLEDFPQKEPLVIFCKFTADIREAVEACRESGRTVSELSGQRKQLEDWQAGKTDVIVIQQQCGGAGIDCTRACFCYYYSLSHSLGDYEQSLARLRRPGQKKTCRYYHSVAAGTVDEAIYAALEKKADVVESIVGSLTRRIEHG